MAKVKKVRINQKSKIWKKLKPIVETREYLKEENIALILINKASKGLAITSKTNTKGLESIGIRAIIELTKPIKLNIPINGTTQIFAKMLNGAKLLK